MIQATNGNFYGTTANGGPSNGGTVFKITSGGKLTNLYTFCTLTNCTDGKLPYSGVMQATDGNFYGTTSSGGANGYGTIFEITPAGKFTTPYSFCSQSSCQDGATPLAGLYEDTGGTLDGTTSVGGLYGSGTRYALSVGLSPFVISTPGNGIVSAPITIVGPDFSGVTSVSFNGTSASFSELSSTVISTTVPSGAATGYISVSGGVYGTMKSNFAFKVTPQLKQFSPTSGLVGTQVTISGISLAQTKNVTIGGAKATFTINSDNQVTATVPSTAKTGKIVITTLGGSATSVSSFTVTN